MAGATGDNEQIDIAELLERSDLSAVDQRRVHNASDNGMIDGWTPTRQSVLRASSSLPLDGSTPTNTSGGYWTRKRSVPAPVPPG
jgi:hypothetical protein